MQYSIDTYKSKTSDRLYTFGVYKSINYGGVASVGSLKAEFKTRDEAKKYIDKLKEESK